MRKLTLVGLIAVSICTLANAVAADQYPDPFEQTDLNHPLLAKVFPGLLFTQKMISMCEPTAYMIGTTYKGKYWRMPRDFNILADEFRLQATASIEEKLESFILLWYWIYGAEVRILTKETISEQLSFHFNWKFTAETKWPEAHQNWKEEIIIAYDGNEILEAQRGLEGKHTRTSFYPIRVKEP